MDEQSAFIIKIVVLTLAAVLMAVIGAMLYGLFDTRVDNTEIFKILAPAFQTIVGVFVGILGGRSLDRRS